jgi:hypothetical protein
MDTPPKKRRFWQLHLSTAVLLVLFSGMYMGLIFSFGQGRMGSSYECYGFPFPALFIPQSGFRNNAYIDPDGVWIPIGKGIPSTNLKSTHYTLVHWGTAAIDGVIFFGSLILVTACFEYLIRRREGRKP